MMPASSKTGETRSGLPEQGARILAFDTASARASIALLEGNELRAELRLHTSQTHSVLLVNSIEYLLKRAGWTLKDLNVIAVGIGPGSFTGIRIGVATALGFSQSLSIPFAGVSGLDALAHQVPLQSGTIAQNLAVVLDAHRSQVFYAEYAAKKGKISNSVKSMLISVSDLERRLAGRHLYIAGDVQACRLDEWENGTKPAVLSVDMFLASGIGRLALSQKRRWRSGDFVAEPMYVRPPDALKKRTGKP